MRTSIVRMGRRRQKRDWILGKHGRLTPLAGRLERL
jgi:hypothetical protein